MTKKISTPTQPLEQRKSAWNNNTGTTAWRSPSISPPGEVHLKPFYCAPYQTAFKGYTNSEDGFHSINAWDLGQKSLKGITATKAQAGCVS
jgi:hypothetical protein